MKIDVKKIDKSSKAFILGFLFLALFCLISIAYRMYQYGLDFYDIDIYYTESRLFLMGINPTEAARNGMIIPELGDLPSSMANYPWVYPLALVVTGSFLSRQHSYAYYFIMTVVLFIIMEVCVYKRLKKEVQNHEFKENYSWIPVLGLLAVIVNLDVSNCLMTGNIGTVTVLLVIIAISLCDENEYLAGIAIAFAMIKAHTIIPFLIVWLVKKKWKLLFTAGGIDILAWGIASVHTRTLPLKFLMDVFTSTTDSGDGDVVGFWTYGIFDYLNKVNILTVHASLIASALFGLFVLFILLIINKKNELWNQYRYIGYSLPTMISMIWFYKSSSDYILLWVITWAVFEAWTFVEHNAKNIISMLLIVFFVNMKPFRLIFYAISLFFGGNYSSLVNVTWELNIIAIFLSSLFLILSASKHDNNS